MKLLPSVMQDVGATVVSHYWEFLPVGRTGFLVGDIPYSNEAFFRITRARFVGVAALRARLLRFAVGKRLQFGGAGFTLCNLDRCAQRDPGPKRLKRVTA